MRGRPGAAYGHGRAASQHRPRGSNRRCSQAVSSREGCDGAKEIGRRGIALARGPCRRSSPGRGSVPGPRRDHRQHRSATGRWRPQASLPLYLVLRMSLWRNVPAAIARVSGSVRLLFGFPLRPWRRADRPAPTATGSGTHRQHRSSTRSGGTPWCRRRGAAARADVVATHLLIHRSSRPGLG